MSLITKYWESQEEIKKRQNDLKFDLTPEEITKLTEESIEYSKKIQDEVANEKVPNFINVVKKLEDLNAFLGPIVNSLTFMQHVSTDKLIREASSESEKKLEAFDIECNLRQDVYANVVKVRDLKENLDEIDKRLLEKTLQDYERNGLGLEKEKREQYKEMKTKISELCNKFQQNLNEDTTKVIFTEKELEGCTKDFLEGLNKDEKGDYIVSLKYPELFPTLLYAKNPETRKKLYLTNASNCNEQNIPILQEVADLRHKCANLMGYETHSDYVLEIRMAKSRKHVLEFLNGLFEKLKPSALKDLEKFLEFKRQDDPKATIIEPWDFRYYNRLRLERDYGVDDDFIKDYFPMEVVTEGMLKIYQKILSLRFEKVENAHVWHEDVITYGVYDKQTNAFLGHFYLDLFPREGKYGHAAAFPLQRTFEIEKGGKRKEIAAAMVANFTKATKDKPSLLKFDEVETYFHEFGHIMHNLCSTARYARMSGTSVERDFVEAPSQMLENWCYQEQVLNLLSGHYQDHNKKLPLDIVQKLKTTKNCSVGILNTRQLFFGIFDQTLHSQGKSDLNHLWSKLTEEVFLIKDDTQFGNPAANFGHLVGGYDAQYYGYLYSEVFSDDMFVNKFLKSEEGVLSEKVGLEYRNHILAPGGSRDSMESLKLFLGREPDQKAFLVNKGLQVSNL